MEIKILGGGCANCKALERLAREAVRELDLSVRKGFIKKRNIQSHESSSAIIPHSII